MVEAAKTALLHRGPVQLKIGACGFQHGQAVIGGPLEQVAQIVAVSVEGPAVVARQERHRGQWASSCTSGPTAASGCAEKSSVVICGPPLLVVGPGNTRKGQLRLVDSEFTK
jgi:hypothetical protein